MSTECYGEAEGYVLPCAAVAESKLSMYVPDLHRRICAECVGCLVRHHAEVVEITQEERDLARRDPLTGLLNKTAFAEDAADLRQRGPAVAIVLDAIEFGEVNKILGHIAGDALLKIIGQQIVDSLRDEDAVVGRVGGDEFAAVASLVPRENFDLTNQERVEIIQARICAAIDQHPQVVRYNQLFDGRLGILSGYAIDEAGELETALLLNNADPKAQGFGTALFSGRYSEMTPEQIFGAFLDQRENLLGQSAD